MEYCQKCGSSLIEGAEFCSKCGTKVVNVDDVATKFCSNCGTKIPATAVFCTHCDTKLITSDSATQSANNSDQATEDTPYNENSRPDPISSLSLYFRDTFKVTKRLGRADFWWAQLPVGVIGTTLALFALGSFERLVFAADPSAAVNGRILISFFLIVVFWIWAEIAKITAGIRRLHDAGLSGAWVLIYLIGVGPIVMLILTLLPSKQINNRYIE